MILGLWLIGVNAVGDVFSPKTQNNDTVLFQRAQESIPFFLD